MRTRYGRLSERPSGSGTADLSERDQWILSSFSFLKRHIVRVKTRKSKVQSQYEMIKLNRG